VTELDAIPGPRGREARMLLEVLNPHPAALEPTAAIVAGIAPRLTVPDLAALRFAVGVAVARASAIELLPPRADQTGEPVHRREPVL